jgi:hypothetical protein
MLTESSVGPLRHLIAQLWCNAVIGYGPSHSTENLGLLGFSLINMRSLIAYVCAFCFKFSFLLFLRIIYCLRW